MTAPARPVSGAPIRAEDQTETIRCGRVSAPVAARREFVIGGEAAPA